MKFKKAMEYSLTFFQLMPVLLPWILGMHAPFQRTSQHGIMIKYIGLAKNLITLVRIHLCSCNPWKKGRGIVIITLKFYFYLCLSCLFLPGCAGTANRFTDQNSCEAMCLERANLGQCPLGMSPLMLPGRNTPKVFNRFFVIS